MAAQQQICLWDDLQGRLYEPRGQVEGLHLRAFEGGFVDAGTEDGLSWLRLLHHCPSDGYLVVMATDGAIPAVDREYTRLMFEDDGFTMRQIGERLAELGATARMGQGDVGRCACQAMGYP
ncbi:hypothetical protein GCM10011392_15410 [Wenxinia marina]|nr:hypothetical protein GCM10011392_15410 [Wenxinia marina]